MIYKISYFSKELRQAYLENKISTKNKAAFALFLGLVSFALYFVAQTLQESVLYDTVPEIMQPSFFSTLYIYIHVALVLNALYFIVYYDTLFFCEIKDNAWYLLAKMGYKPANMIFSKLAAILLSTIFIYTVGFFFTVFMTLFLKYNLIVSYFPALYLSGLFDLVIISIISLALSLFIKTVTNARYFIFFSVFLVIFLKVKLGYYAILANRVAMQNVYNLFDFARSPFLFVAATIILVCFLIPIIKARNISKYYSLFPYVDGGPALPPGLSVVTIDPKTGRKLSRR